MTMKRCLFEIFWGGGNQIVLSVAQQLLCLKQNMNMNKTPAAPKTLSLLSEF